MGNIVSEVEIEINWRRLLRDAHIYRHIVTKIMDAIVGREERRVLDGEFRDSQDS